MKNIWRAQNTNEYGEEIARTRKPRTGTGKAGKKQKRYIGSDRWVWCNVYTLANEYTLWHWSHIHKQERKRLTWPSHIVGCMDLTYLTLQPSPFWNLSAHLSTHCWRWGFLIFNDALCLEMMGHIPLVLAVSHICTPGWYEWALRRQMLPALFALSRVNNRALCVQMNFYIVLTTEVWQILWPLTWRIS